MERSGTALDLAVLSNSGFETATSRVNDEHRDIRLRWAVDYVIDEVALASGVNHHEGTLRHSNAHRDIALSLHFEGIHGKGVLVGRHATLNDLLLDLCRGTWKSDE
jgi:hypothetical protein